jgi:hypothetical protein
VLTLSPNSDPCGLLADAVRLGGLLGPLREVVGTGDGFRLVPFALDRPTLLLAEELALPIEGFASPPGPALGEQLYRLNTKSGFRQAAAALDLPTLPGRFCRGPEALPATIREVAGPSAGAIAKFNRSSNGYGHLLLPRQEISDLARLRQRLRQHLARFPEQPAEFTVEVLAAFVSVPSVEMLVAESGPQLLYLCDQRCRNASFSGMITPPSTDGPGRRLLLRAGLRFGQRVWPLTPIAARESFSRPTPCRSIAAGAT